MVLQVPHTSRFQQTFRMGILVSSLKSKRDVAEEVDPYFAGGLADDLIEAGLDDAQVSKTVRSVIRAVEATGDLLDICNEVERKGYPDIALEIWNIHLASLIAVIPKQRREKYLKIILKIAKGMEG